MGQERLYTTRRTEIVNALVERLKRINGSGDYLTNLWDNVHPRLKFLKNDGNQGGKYNAGTYWGSNFP